LTLAPVRRISHRVKIPALKVASIVAAVILTTVAAVYVARDGEGSRRDRTRAQVPLPVTQGAPAESKVAARPAVTSPKESGDATHKPALTIAELEQHLAGTGPGARDELLQATLPAMVSNNPTEIARFAELQSDPQLRELLVRQVALLWANADTDSTMAWVRSLPDSPERVATLIDVSLSVGAKDPRRAISMREPDVGNVEPDGVLDSLVQQWAEKDFDAALDWTNARPRNAQRDKLLQRLVYVQATNGAPDAARTFVNDAFEDGPLKREAFAIVEQAVQTP
jgi:hypothetical protein